MKQSLFDRMEVRFLNPITTEPKIKRLSSFDIETYGRKNKFLMGTICYYEYKKATGKGFNQREKVLVKHTFWNQDEMIEELMTNPRYKHNDHMMFATNLYFDLACLLKGTKYMYDVKPVERGGLWIFAQWALEEKRKLRFYDTLAHMRMSVKQMGELIGNEKGEQPTFLGRKPKGKDERMILEEYNIQDAIVTLDFTEWLQTRYNEMGCNMKITAPSSTMDLYRRKYQKERIKQPSFEIITKTRLSLKGGRTEVFKRGKTENAILYDFNSMYPAMMTKKRLPHPNYIYHARKGSRNRVLSSEGCSLVDMYCPETLNIPYLHARINNKLLFVTGHLKNQWYTHLEIRKALELGYELREVRETIYYTRTWQPFKEMMEDIYKLRVRDYENQPLNAFYKLLMNSLFGKFGQKTESYDVYPMSQITVKQLNWYCKNALKVRTSPDGHWLFVKIDKTENYSTFINPILSSYITAQARTHLYEHMTDDIVYCDTDSIMTCQDLTSMCGEGLGELKVEDKLEMGIFVRPKFYLKKTKKDTRVRIKGIPKASVEVFYQAMRGEEITYEKMTKFRESMTRCKDFNEVIQMTKKLGVEDDKREWPEPFDPEVTQESKPLYCMEDGELRPTEQ